MGLRFNPWTGRTEQIGRNIRSYSAYQRRDKERQHAKTSLSSGKPSWRPPSGERGKAFTGAMGGRINAARPSMVSGARQPSQWQRPISPKITARTPARSGIGYPPASTKRPPASQYAPSQPLASQITGRGATPTHQRRLRPFTQFASRLARTPATGGLANINLRLEEILKRYNTL